MVGVVSYRAFGESADACSGVAGPAGGTSSRRDSGRGVSAVVAWYGLPRVEKTALRDCSREGGGGRHAGASAPDRPPVYHKRFNGTIVRKSSTLAPCAGPGSEIRGGSAAGRTALRVLFCRAARHALPEP